MSGRVSYIIAVILLLLGAGLRVWNFTTLPSGFHEDEIINIRIAETAKSGNIEVFYDLGGEGREGFYQITLAFVTSMIGGGTLGYRLLSLWVNLIMLAVVYAAGKRLFGAVGGLSAMGLLAVNLWSNLLSRQVIPYTMLPFWVAVVILMLSIALPIYKRRRKRGDNTTIAAFLGVLIGISLYIHPVGLLILAFSSLFIIFMLASGQQMSRRRLSYIGFALLIIIIMGMPYLISSLRNPQLGGIDRLIGEKATLTANAVLDGISALGIRGDANPLHNIPGRPLFEPVALVMMIIGFLVALRDWRQPRFALLLIASLVLSPVFLFSAKVPNFLNYAASLPILVLFFGLGITILMDYLPRWVIVGGAGLLIIANGFWTVQDLFINWQNTPSVQATKHYRLGQLAAYIDRTADEYPTIICGWTTNQSPTSSQLTDAQLISIMLNRKDSFNIRYVDCYNALVFTNGGETQQIILPNPANIMEAHPTIRAWLQAGDYVQDIHLPPDGVLLLNQKAELEALLGQLTDPVIGSKVSYAPEAGGSSEVVFNTPISFGGNVTFLGYQLVNGQDYHPGDIITLITYWRTQGKVPPDLRLFTHILSDPGASPPANTDILNLNPRYLQDRDVFIQVTYIVLPTSLPAGQYQVSIGAYQTTSDLRLDVLDNGQARGTRIFLQSPIRIQ
ncbi:MAG: hypothetical protein CUN56_04045 [Phototrophicales bacterium]|nr:MAG: hypothetical protein CUN56_04045 [Phototrophicales bacterium]RMG75460.1 MAG: hypothetical protein D6711_06560 [Chloroflexota bacterium]